MNIVELWQRMILPKEGELAPANAEIAATDAPAPRPSAATQAIRDRFLRNFRKASIEDVLITDPNQPDKAPMEHFHVRLYLSEENLAKMEPDQRLVFMTGLTDQGKGVLAQYGLTYVEEINYDKNKGLLQFDCDFPAKIENRTQAAQAIQQDLQAGIDRAHASLGIVR